MPLEFKLDLSLLFLVLRVAGLTAFRLFVVTSLGKVLLGGGGKDKLFVALGANQYFRLKVILFGQIDRLMKLMR